MVFIWSDQNGPRDFDCLELRHAHLIPSNGQLIDLTDGLVVEHDLDGVRVGIDMQIVSQVTGFKGEEVRCSYLENEGTPHIRLTDKPVTRETSPNWHINISYAEDGSIVEVVLLDFSALGKLNKQLVKAADR